MASDKLKYLYFLLLALSIFTVSCGDNEVDEAFIDKSFLEKEPCAPPCWYGLELEESTEEDVYDVLKQLPFVKNDNIFEQSTTWINGDSVKVISYKCVYPRGLVCGRIYIVKDTVREIITKVNYDLPLSLIVEEIGEPEYIIIHNPIDSNGCEISLDWPKKQISVSSDSQEKCPAPNTKFSPDAKVTYLMYAVSESFTASVENQYPWPGFVQP